MQQLENTITNKQERFCLEYIIDYNATQAAIRAGYSKKTAKEQGSRLLTKVNVIARVDELQAEIQSQKIADATEVMETLTRTLRREESEYVVVTKKTHHSFYDENGKKVIQDGEEVEVVPIKSRLCDVNRAAELLGKRYSLFTDKVMMDVMPVIIHDDLCDDG